MMNLTRYAACLLLVGAVACNNSKGTDTDTDDTEADTQPMDSEVDTESTTDTETTTDTEVAATADCATYCSTFQASCSDEPVAFPNEGACLAACTAADWDAGTVEDTSGNTIGCRIYHATAAEGDAPTHCPHASLYGGNMCGDLVSNYCDLISNVCTGDNAPTWTTDCATDAAAYPMGTPGDMTGDTLDCRLYHLGAALGDADTHCGHAGPTGGGVCSNG